jgi:hypothetical protein
MLYGCVFCVHYTAKFNRFAAEKVFALKPLTRIYATFMETSDRTIDSKFVSCLRRIVY